MTNKILTLVLVGFLGTGIACQMRGMNQQPEGQQDDTSGQQKGQEQTEKEIGNPYSPNSLYDSGNAFDENSQRPEEGFGA